MVTAWCAASTCGTGARVFASDTWPAAAGLKPEMAEGRALFGALMNGGSNPPAMPSGRPPCKDGANTNVVLFDGRLLVFAEPDVPHELRPHTLETVSERYDFKGALTDSATTPRPAGAPGTPMSLPSTTSGPTAPKHRPSRSDLPQRSSVRALRGGHERG
ncbi:carotenoid oxygenase family protein [Streptomyces sp. NPDC013157]|uniref:carotenoid oxygenase family protein n=1 Tax=Streptomyces sp. NPDC013157 TaxID=3364861 RepID=UPI0036AE8877